VSPFHQKYRCFARWNVINNEVVLNRGNPGKCEPGCPNQKATFVKTEISNFRPDLQMYHVDDAAAISRLSRNTLYNQINAGRLKSVRIGGRRLIPETALREFLQIDGGK
jgi:excisionase family DNA binding protein